MLRTIVDWTLGVWRKCGNCNGTGEVGGKTCPACEGAGGIDTTTI